MLKIGRPRRGIKKRGRKRFALISTSKIGIIGGGSRIKKPLSKGT